ncbi:MAG: alpha/beta hydrolase [Anaerolineae bacterium]
MNRWLKRLAIVLLILLVVIFVLPLIVPLPPVGTDPAVFADPDGRFITVDGLQTYVREAGDPAGATVILLHGWGGSTFTWRDTIPALAEAGFHVIAFDRPPYGLSQKTGDLPLSMTEQAAFTAAFMDVLNISSASLVGHSMGGGVIAYFAVLYPERVERLGFADGAVRLENGSGEAGGGGSPGFARAVLNFPPARWWARLGMRAFLRPYSLADFQKTAYYDPTVVTDEVIAGYGRALEVTGWDEAILEILTRNFGDDVPLTDAQIQAIEMSALIQWGEHDTWVPPALGERLRDLLPNDTYLTYAQSGHLPMEEEPAAFNSDLIAFLNGSQAN